MAIVVYVSNGMATDQKKEPLLEEESLNSRLLYCILLLCKHDFLTISETQEAINKLPLKAKND